MKGTLWCLHGALGGAEDWRGLRVPGRALRRVDLWRFLDCCPMSLAEFGAALNREAESSGGRKILLGYSMGGRLALHALLAGGPWEAAVIVSAHPGLEREEDRVARRGADAEWASKALTGEWSQFLAEWEAQPVLAGVKLPGREARVSRRRAIARSFIDWSLGEQEPLWDRLGEIKVPTLWVAGERDGKFRQLAERAVGLLPSGNLWVAPGAGHRVPWEPGFSERVGEFLERVGS